MYSEKKLYFCIEIYKVVDIRKEGPQGFILEFRPAAFVRFCLSTIWKPNS